MRLLRRNCTEFEYLPYLGVTEDVIEPEPEDEPVDSGEETEATDGVTGEENEGESEGESEEESEDEPEVEHTGEFHPTYGNPVVYRGNISAPNGYTNQTFYGEEIRYTHTLVMEPTDDIDEHGLIRWKGELYDIQAVRPSLNALSIALKKQTTDGAEDE